MDFANWRLVAIVLLLSHLYNDWLNNAAVMTPTPEGRFRLVIEPPRGCDSNQPEPRPGGGDAASLLPGHPTPLHQNRQSRVQERPAWFPPWFACPAVPFPYKPSESLE
jgi:hypothetical protein